MRDVAAAVLARHGALELFGAREATRLELESLRRDIALGRGEVPWWERRATTQSDPQLVQQLEARASEVKVTDAARLVALDAALDAAQNEMPPIEIGRRVATCFDLARKAGLGSSEADTSLVVALEDLADRVLSIWAPGFSTDVAAEELMSPERAAAAAQTDPGPVRDDPTLGWAPATPVEIVSRAARALQRPQIEAARALLVRERQEYEDMAARLREVRKGSSVLRKLVGADDEARTAIDTTQRRVAVEEHELTAAWETLHHEVSQALAVVPPLHIARTAIAAAGVLRARLTTWETVIGIDVAHPGAFLFMNSVSRRGRAVMFAALRELELATEQSFPGLLALLTPRGAAQAARHEAAEGPYRARGELEAGAHAVPRNEDLLATVIDRAKAGGLDQRVGALVAHGAALGALSRKRKRVEGERGLFGKVTAWVSSEDDPLDARGRWHRALAFSMLDQAETTVARARAGLFALDFRAALTAAAAQFFAIRMYERQGLFDVQCTLVRQQETLDALLAARRFLVSAWGDPGDRLALANDVGMYIGRALPGPSPFGPGSSPRRLERHELVVLLGEALRSAPYLDAANRVVDAQRRYVESARLAADAASRITFWDQLNFFTDSDAEATLKGQTQVGDELYALGRLAFTQVNEMLEGALRLYPPAVVLYRLEEAIIYVRGVAVVKVMEGFGKNRRYVCRLFGHAAAHAALDRLATAAGQTFGVMLSDTEILAHHWERLLDAPT